MTDKRTLKCKINNNKKIQYNSNNNGRKERIKNTLKIKITGLNGGMDMGQTSKSNFEINN